MKKFIQIMFVLAVVMVVSGCQVYDRPAYSRNRSTISAPGREVSDLSVFGRQPSKPTQVATRTTVGAVYGGDILVWNEMRPRSYARVQRISADTPILFDREFEWAWKEVCYNRITPVEEEEEGGEEPRQTQHRYSFGINLPVSVNFIPATGWCRRPLPPPCYDYAPPRCHWYSGGGFQAARGWRGCR